MSEIRFWDRNWNQITRAQFLRDPDATATFDAFDGSRWTIEGDTPGWVALP